MDETLPRMSDTLPLLLADPGLGAELRERFEGASSALTVTTLGLAPGAWTDARWELENADLGLLVLDGWVAREVQLSRRVSCDLAGPGDVLQPPAGLGDSLLPMTVEWSAVTAVRVAIINVEQLRPWPEVERQLLARIAGRSLRLAFEHAILAVPGIEARIVAYLSHLAAFWGTVTPDGIALGPPLSHARLAQLVGSRRPTVTAALGRLQQDGTLARRPDGRWVLRPGQHPRAPGPGRRGARPPAGAIPLASGPAASPAGASVSALRFQELAGRVGALEARRREQLEELAARMSSVQEEATAMALRAEQMRRQKADRDGGAEGTTPSPGGPGGVS